MSVFICKICGKEFIESNAYARHIKEDHKLQMQEYYDKYLKKPGEGLCAVCGNPTEYLSTTKGYRVCCSAECSKIYKREIGKKKIEEAKENNESVSMKCEICDEIITAPVDFKLESAFNAHLKEKHNITYSKAYYDTYLKKDEKEGICPICKKPTSYRGLLKGYAKFCSNECFGASVKKDENGFSSHSSGIVAALKRSIAAITENIKTKYKRFLATENKTKFFKIGEGFKHKTISSKEVVITPDNDKALIRTEISCNQEQKQYTGTQTRYIPKQEHCTTTTYIDDIIDDGNSMNESEWCR